MKPKQLCFRLFLSEPQNTPECIDLQDNRIPSPFLRNILHYNTNRDLIRTYSFYPIEYLISEIRNKDAMRSHYQSDHNRY